MATEATDETDSLDQLDQLDQLDSLGALDPIWQFDLIAAIWTAIWTSAGPLTRIIRNFFIMPIPPDPLPPAPLPPQSTVVSQSPKSVRPISPLSHIRHGCCTHVRMERLYGPYLCSWCHYPSPLGWVYSCLQNDESYLFDSEILIQNLNTSTLGPIAGRQPNGQPTNRSNKQAADASHVSIEPAKGINGHSKTEHQDRVGSTNVTSTQRAEDVIQRLEPEEKAAMSHHQEPRLSPGIEKAIEEGHYNQEQIVKMRAQRQKVIDAINATKKKIRLYSENSPDLLSPPRPTASQSTGANSYLPFPVINEAGEIPNESDKVVIRSSKPRLYPRCKHRACPSCRPTYMDRVWLNIDDVLSMQASIPNIDLKSDNRPISNVATVRKMGLPKPANSRSRPPYSTMGIFSPSTISSSSSSSLPRRLPTNFLVSENHFDLDTEPESRGFRESMKRAFRGMLSRRRDSFPARSSRMRRSKEMPPVEFDMELWRELNDELLQEASNAPLPGHDGMDGLGDDEREVEAEESVTVSEDGTDLGTADLIMFM